LLAKRYLFAERGNMKKDRTKSVLIRLTEEEKNKIQEMAESEEMKVEPFVRKKIFSNDIKKLSNENDALREEIKALKQEVITKRKENEDDRENWSKLTSQMFEILDEMKKEKEVLLIETKEKKPFWKRIFGR
jgi:hypothetical protein